MQTSGAPETIWTVDAIVRWISGDFATRGIESPRLEAELLVCLVLGCTRIQLILDRDRPLADTELARARSLVARRRRREPIAYLTGRREFYGHEFRVDRRVLIPRPDTETLVETALARTRDRSLHGHMLDLCTGSGNVAIAFAKERPTWQVCGGDISDDALTVARGNALRLGAVWSVAFRQGDLFDAAEPEPYDLVTANPPYVSEREMLEVAPDIREHEPRLALEGGPDGLDVVRRIAAQCSAHLVASGVLAMEIGCEQGDATRELLEHEGFVDVRVDRDLGGRPRVVSGVRRG